MTGAEPKLWFVISPPDGLPTALAVAQALCSKFSGGVHLLREDSKWWERARWQPQLLWLFPPKFSKAAS